MHFKRILFFTFTLACLLSNIGVHGFVADSIAKDSSAIETRLPDEEVINDYKNSGDFDYSRERETDLSAWEKLQRWLQELLGFGTYGDSKVFKILFWVIIAIAVIAIIYFLFKNEISIFFSKRNPTTALSTTFIDLNADTLSLELLLKNAVEQKDYKEAIRLYYTLALKTLAENNLISLRIDKTNNEYLFELPVGEAQPSFKQLTYYFDYVFYGRFDVTEAIFLSTQQSYNQLVSTLKTSPKH